MVKRFSILLILILAACAATNQAPTQEPVSTSTLIAPTATFTPVPPTETATDSNLPAPQDLATPLGVGTSLPPESTLESGTTLIDRDPIAAELVRLARELVGSETDLPPRRIQLLEVRSVVWTDSSLNCPLPDTLYLSLLIDGYRIVLRAGEQEYIFHTDIDRVMPCALENEQLPDAEATEAVDLTLETTLAAET
jgi:hypothetical protein